MSYTSTVDTPPASELGVMSFGSPVIVASPNVVYTDERITSRYEYQSVHVSHDGTNVNATPVTTTYELETQRVVPRTGVMVVGLGGNNGTTLFAGLLANRQAMKWETKEGMQTSNFYGSLTQCSTVNLGMNDKGDEIHVPFSSLVPMVNPCDIVVGGWDISSANLAESMGRARVLDLQLQKQLSEEMSKVRPLRAVHRPAFIATNQEARADNTKSGTLSEQLEEVREDIRRFKKEKDLEKVIVLWTANTERIVEVQKGIHDTEENLSKAVADNSDEVSASTIYCLAAIFEGCSYINGSPQNTFVPGVLEAAERRGIFLAGDDFKTGQTKFKSVVVDFLVSAGIKPMSIVSYNHLGNNDGLNLSSPNQFRSKEVSKSCVIDDMVKSNRLLYDEGESPDHCVVIKYVPYVGDSKRAMDEYVSKIFMNGHNTIVVHNTCEDSLLATPIMIDLVVLTELLERVKLRRCTADSGKKESRQFEPMHSALSILSYLTKAPFVPPGTPVVNALARQRECLCNFLRACVGLPPNNHLLLAEKLCR